MSRHLQPTRTMAIGAASSTSLAALDQSSQRRRTRRGLGA